MKLIHWYKVKIEEAQLTMQRNVALMLGSTLLTRTYLSQAIRYTIKMVCRRKVIVVIALMCTCLVIWGIFVEIHFLNVCTICYQGDSYYNISLERNETFFTLLPNINCKKNPPFLVLLITSIHDQQAARMAIRQSWGKPRTIQKQNVVAFFLLGSSVIRQHEDQANLVDEHNKYNDIIQRDFIDAYYNLTLKTVMGLDWIHHFCPETTFVMKTDTDMFVNTIYLVDLLLRKKLTANFFTGFLKPDEYPIRNIFSKWYVSRLEYPYYKYPPFCSGTGYVFSVDVALKIINMTSIVPFFKLEDVYVGLCLDKLKIPLQELHNKQTFFPERVSFSVCNYRNIVTSHGVQPKDILLYWEAMEWSETEKC
ncbi:beta-1,3-galactosyltransferase 5-like [Pelobates cultripes]|uniref:Hexosyltransferase n=2 Tax=Pelobates cultripes TaxID=61616 RepID=A0AAD1VI29_PELCU|nr:beta-1,3-galactosyltransferase 5-like [Pelobates cultripes]